MGWIMLHFLENFHRTHLCLTRFLSLQSKQNSESAVSSTVNPIINKRSKVKTEMETLPSASPPTQVNPWCKLVFNT